MQTIKDLEKDISFLDNLQNMATVPDVSFMALITLAIKTFIYCYCEAAKKIKEDKIAKLIKDEFEKTIADKEKEKLGKVI